MTIWLPTYLKDMSIYLTDPSSYMYGRWDQPASAMEGGVDLASPGGTPVYALADGPIIGAGNFWHSADLYTPNSGNPGYGVVTQRITVPGYGLQDLYYQHININPAIISCQGNCTQSLKRGDLIGTVEPDVGEIEMGFNANWGGVWGVDHPGAWATDPRPMLLALMNEGVPPLLGNQPTYSGLSYSGGSFDIGGSIAQALGLPDLSGVVSWLNNPIRIFKMLAGILLVGGALFLLISPEAESTLKTVAKVGLLA